MNYIETDIYL